MGAELLLGAARPRRDWAKLQVVATNSWFSSLLVCSWGGARYRGQRNKQRHVYIRGASSWTGPRRCTPARPCNARGVWADNRALPAFARGQGVPAEEAEERIRQMTERAPRENASEPHNATKAMTAKFEEAARSAIRLRCATCLAFSASGASRLALCDAESALPGRWSF